jgi:hypothetical protein
LAAEGVVVDTPTWMFVLRNPAALFPLAALAVILVPVLIMCTVYAIPLGYRLLQGTGTPEITLLFGVTAFLAVFAGLCIIVCWLIVGRGRNVVTANSAGIRHEFWIGQRRMFPQSIPWERVTAVGLAPLGAIGRVSYSTASGTGYIGIGVDDATADRMSALLNDLRTTATQAGLT